MGVGLCARVDTVIQLSMHSRVDIAISGLPALSSKTAIKIIARLHCAGPLISALRGCSARGTIATSLPHNVIRTPTARRDNMHSIPAVDKNAVVYQDPHIVSHVGLGTDHLLGWNDTTSTSITTSSTSTSITIYIYIYAILLLLPFKF